RQRRAFENVRYVLEERAAGRAADAGDGDDAYAAAVAAPIRDTQALVVAREGTVLLRLLGCLRPYRRELITGMAAASVITAVGIAPPYIAGRLIDGVVRPAQQGTLAIERARTIAWLAVGAMALVYVIRQLAALVRL